MAAPGPYVNPTVNNITTVVSWAPAPVSKSFFSEDNGILALQLMALPTVVPGLQMLAGSYHIVDGLSTSSVDLRGRVKGVYFNNLGVATLAASVNGASISVVHSTATVNPSSPAPAFSSSRVSASLVSSSYSGASSDGLAARGGEDGTDPADVEAEAISQRLLRALAQEYSTGALPDRCLLRMDFQVAPLSRSRAQSPSPSPSPAAAAEQVLAVATGGGTNAVVLQLPRNC